MRALPGASRVDAVFRTRVVASPNGRRRLGVRALAVFLAIATVFTIRGTGYAHLRSTVDEVDNVSTAISYGATGEDTDSTATGATAANTTWRYLFNEVGDLVAVRDPRGCGQNFYYDHAGRLLGEDYVTCDEAQVQGDDPDPDDDVPSDAIALGEIGGSGHEVDVRYFFDEAPPWATDFSSATPSAPITGFLEGRLTAVSDRASRTLYEYDTRGSTVWAGRQIALVPNDTETYGDLTNPGSGPPVVVTSEDITPSTRAYDTTHSYAQVHEYDHGGRPISLELPRDPDWSGSGSAPVIKGSMIYTRRGMPYRTQLHVDSTAYYIVYLTTYSASRQLRNVTYGDNAGGARTNTRLWMTYDDRLRPDRQYLVRDEEEPQDDAVLNSIGPYLFNNHYTWDDANNLKLIYNFLPGTEFSEGHVPTTSVIAHDGLYRVVDVDFLYRNKATGSGNAPDIATDWRDSREDHRGADPMRERPAAMLPTLPTNRVAALDYQYDWLANMTSWTDDASSFYERSIGDITNGYDEQKRPSALYLSTNLPDAAPAMYESGVDRGGWLEVDYGVSGNVVAMTVHAQCADASSTDLCWDDRTDDVDTRRDDIRNNCVCAAEAHYQYRWDELNRITEARRYDRAGGTGDWDIAVRQRARYDSGNQRIIKQTIEDEPDIGDPAERVHLYVYPGDFERSGLVLDSINGEYDADTVLGTETQYLVSGARVVWKNDHASGWGLDPEARMTYAIGDIIGSTTAVFDIYSGELLETRTYYPNGAQETQRARTPAEMSGAAGPFQLEPMGFTGKEADDEVGLTYFGERHLIQHIGRWASPDPLHVHAVGGGEALNSYHYVAGNLLQARDPLGLDCGKNQSCAASFEADASQSSADYSEADGSAVNTSAPPMSPAPNMTVGQARLPNRRRPDVVVTVAEAVPIVGDVTVNMTRAGWAADEIVNTVIPVSSQAGDNARPGATPAEAASNLLMAPSAMIRAGVDDAITMVNPHASEEERVRANARTLVAVGTVGMSLAASRVIRAFRGACFVAGTVVLTPHGLRHIEDLQPGDTVLSQAESGGDLVVSTVVRSFVRHHEPILEVQLIDGSGRRDEVLATGDHPFWVEGTGWVPAGRLRAGDPLLHANEEALWVEGVEWTGHLDTVYNIEVADTHTYFVGELGAWVHNNDSCVGRAASNPTRGRFDAEHTGPRGYDNAVEAGRRNAGNLGQDTNRMYDPETGTLIGERSADGTRGWRIDHDHVNYWDWSGGKKGNGGHYGHEFFPPSQAGPHSRHIGYAPWE